jgi:hypothetical protein
MCEAWAENNATENHAAAYGVLPSGTALCGFWRTGEDKEKNTKAASRHNTGARLVASPKHGRRLDTTALEMIPTKWQIYTVCFSQNTAVLFADTADREL